MADDNTLNLQAGRDVNIGGHVVGGDMIVRQEAPTTPTPAAPPRPPAHFAGRERELSKLIQALVAGEAVAITALQGMGGIGKTALAQKAAEMLQPHFPGGVLWWTAGPRADIFTALDVWARHADPRSDLSRLPEAEARAGVVRAMLAKLGRLCAILDDVWDEAAARVLLAAIPPGCPILLTTRDADLAKALRCRVERLGALTVDESVALLEKLLGPLRPPQPPLSGGAGGVGEAAREIATLTEGLPLALELIAGLADSPADLPALAQQLKHHKPLDTLKLGSGADREHSVEACFALSYNALDPEAQRRFRALGVFAPAPFDEDAVLAVWGEALDPPQPPFRGGRGGAPYLKTLTPPRPAHKGRRRFGGDDRRVFPARPAARLRPGVITARGRARRLRRPPRRTLPPLRRRQELARGGKRLRPDRARLGVGAGQCAGADCALCVCCSRLLENKRPAARAS